MEPYVLLCARDPAVVEAVEVSAAAFEVPLRVAHHPDDVRVAWPDASLRLVSTEVASRWSGVAPGRAYLVGDSAADLARCSAGLGLPVLPLPDHGGHLAEALSAAMRSERSRGGVVALVGASGGLGVSTLAASLALVAASDGAPTAAVDLAQAGGGLDLLVGAETVAGVRWPDLGHARGELADLVAGLPTVEGASFLAQGRESPAVPPQAAVSAAVGSLARSVGLVVIDAGREAPAVDCDQVVLVVGADVRSVASARMMAETRSVHPTSVVVRPGPGRSIPAEVVARSLGLPVLGAVAHDPAVPRLAELGMLPVAGPARRYRRHVAQLLTAVRNG
ncbi:septum site-determining protein Ssd [Tessaracoccus lubricantis]